MSDPLPPFACFIQPDSGAPAVVVRGELDLATVPDVDDQLAAARERADERILLDLRGVTFTDSTGINLVVRWHQAALREGWELRVALGSHIEPVFELSGVKPLLRLAAEA